MRLLSKVKKQASDWLNKVTNFGATIISYKKLYTEEHIYTNFSHA